MSVGRDQLLDYLDTLLESRGAEDYGPNGLQVEGRDLVETLVVGVSACRELHERAIQCGADAILVHHGLFWRSVPVRLTGWFLRRVEPLVRHGVSLFAYHLPLDRHSRLGNNAVAMQAFGVENAIPFAPHFGKEVGLSGSLAEPRTPREFAADCQRVFDQEPLHLGAGPPLIRTIGVVSGGGQTELYAAIDAGLDAFVTGEVSEWVTNVAREAGIHYFAAGHYATERLGVRALGDHLAERFSLRVEFVDVPNPV